MTGKYIRSEPKNRGGILIRCVDAVDCLLVAESRKNGFVVVVVQACSAGALRICLIISRRSSGTSMPVRSSGILATFT
jgi:hypothetical protein